MKESSRQTRRDGGGQGGPHVERSERRDCRKSLPDRRGAGRAKVVVAGGERGENKINQQRKR